MAERPIWRGHLRLALVSCPVALYTAHHERNNLHFHFINPKTGHRVRMITQDAETGEELSRRDLARGYEFKKDTYLILTDEDFESARIDSSSTLNVQKFVDAGSIDPIYFDTSYFMLPDGEAGQDVYVVLREAFAKTRRVALSRLVIARRERAVAIMPLEDGLVVHTLQEERDLSDWHSLFERIPKAKPDGEMVKLAEQLIDRQSGPYEPGDLEDRYEARLRKVIDAKLQGEGIEPEREEPDRSNVVDLMTALKNSLNRIGEKPAGRSGPKAGKPAPQKPASEKPRPAPRKSAARKRA